ncbi:HDIG domain-containing protein [Patescibacteria group bacterium]|nr:HDIG domain-containing protein [Patescibacteria group bacterium]
MNREEAKELLYQHVLNENLRKHHLAAEAAMRAFAVKFGGDLESWGLAGLLHDMDWEQTKDNPDQHTKVAEQILKEKGVSEEVINAVKAHHPTVSGKWPQTQMEKTIYYTEELTGLITAAALVQPNKKLASVTLGSVLRKLKNKSFAAGVDREIVAKSSEALDLPLEEIIETVLQAMQQIHEDLGL